MVPYGCRFWLQLWLLGAGFGILRALYSARAGRSACLWGNLSMNLELFLQFAAQQWILFAALIVLIIMLIRHEGAQGAQALTPQQSIGQVNSNDGVFLDIREAVDYKKGHIADSVHIPNSKLGARMNELNHYKDKPVIVVCRMGQTAGAASKQLLDAGFSQVYKMKGGMMEWEALQLPVVTKA